MADQLLPTLREALSNVARHAEASAVTVTVAVDGEDVVLAVADNGKGLPPSGRRSGLANMEQRANDLGGTFTATNGPAVAPSSSGGCRCAARTEPATCAPRRP